MIQINKKLIISAGLALTALLPSCVKDLDRLPTNTTTEATIFDNELKTKQALAKVYGAYALTGNRGPAGEGDVAGIDEGFSDFLRNYFNLQELCTGEAICAWGDEGLPDLHNMNWSSSNRFITGLYYRSLYQVKLATNFLRTSQAKQEDKTIKVYRAEARFLRAFQYWILMDLFGNPPMINEELGTGKVYPKQFKRAELFAYIESELKAVEGDLAAPKTNEYGRADRAAAWALLSRLYLNAEVYTGQERYAESAKYAEKVIASGYSLAPKYETLFLADNNMNNPETILSINYDGIKGQNWGGMTFLTNSSTSGDVQKELGINSGVGGWGGNRATSALNDLFKAKDSRHLMGYKTAEVSKVSDFMQGIWVYKFRNVKADGSPAQHNNHADVDFPLFRLAELYLNYAEAAARGKADKAKGLEYINKVRERAFGNKLNNFTKLELKDILDERGRELYWECLRRTDLIRFGDFVSNKDLWPWKGGVKAGRAVSEHYRLYPIPANDMLANPNLKQNPNY